MSTRKWMLIYSKPRHELKLSKRLAELGIEVYCPTVKTVRQWSDRKKKVEEPLFKSYVFVKVDEKERESVFWVPGFSRFVFWLGKPVIVREAEIQATRDFLSRVEHDTIKLERFKLGEELRVSSGPLKDTKGTLLRLHKNKAVLQIDTLGTLVTAEVALTELVV